MFGFFGVKDKRYGAVIDVGSGSVGVALVFSDPRKQEAQILWSHRERMLIRDEDTPSASKKLIATTILKAFLELGNNGLRSLRQFDRDATLSEVFVSVAAPWSYTVVKTVSLAQEREFVITRKLIGELAKKATAEGQSSGKQNVLTKKFTLSLVGTATISLAANDYVTKNPFGSPASKVTLTQLVEMVENDIVEAVTSAAGKILPGAELKISTFMDTYYSALNALKPDTSEICLVNITAEATELGIVRNNVLEYVTHVPFGGYTIARKIAALSALPKEEALGYIRENNVATQKTLSESKREKLEGVVEEYTGAVTNLFKKTGDTLSIPKTIFMHSDKATESFFQARLKEAAKRTTGSEPKVHLVTSKYFKENGDHDSSILLSACVFHKNLAEVNYLEI